jgi:Protein of unknown function (DUF3987)
MTDEISEVVFRRKLDPVALHGLAGDIVRTLDPVTEADPVAVLLNVLALFGAHVGLRPHMRVEGSAHRAIVWPVVVGRTSRARKSTARSRAQAVFDGIDSPLKPLSGFGSGEKLIERVSDAVYNVAGELISGSTDRRLVVSEDEFSMVLKAANREGSNMSGILRDAWDGKQLAHRTLGRGDVVASNPHIVVSAAITREERKTLSASDAQNGFGNRFLWVFADRSKLLPSSPELDEGEARRLRVALERALVRARAIDLVVRSGAAEHLWVDLYERMADDDPPGLVGALTSRAEAQVMRVSLIYALMDGSAVVDVPHLQAAWELWKHCRASCDAIFADLTGDMVADKLLTAVRAGGAEGITRKAIYERVFAKSKSSARIDDAVALLVRLGQIRTETTPTDGRPVTTLYPVAQGNEGAVLSVLTVQSGLATGLSADNTVSTAPRKCSACGSGGAAFSAELGQMLCADCFGEVAS